jgi:hypothetical protein
MGCTRKNYSFGLVTKTFNDPTGMYEEKKKTSAEYDAEYAENKRQWEERKAAAQQGGEFENLNHLNNYSNAKNNESQTEDDCDCGCPGKPPCENQGASVGQSFVPFYGSYLDMTYRLEIGEYFRSAGNLGLFVSDVFLVKSLFVGAGKGGLKALGKNYKYWSGKGWRNFYGKKGFAEVGQPLHHVFWHRNGAKRGDDFAWWAKNQMWNLMPVSKELHILIHTGYGFFKKFYFGTPNWFKLSLFSGGGKVFSAIDKSGGSSW